MKERKIFSFFMFKTRSAKISYTMYTCSICLYNKFVRLFLRTYIIVCIIKILALMLIIIKRSRKKPNTIIYFKYNIIQN